MTLAVVQLLCAAIVALYVALRLRRAPAGARLRVLRRLALVAAASWVGEDTLIRAYHYYSYSPAWRLHLDQVPLLVVLIWPVVIDSAHRLARHLCGDGRRLIPLTTAGFVLADASLIEPIAVRAGLWRWSEPGLFGVPLVGIFGWVCFTFVCVMLLETIDRMRAPATSEIVLIAVAPVATHAMVLGGWWLALRWTPGEIPSQSAIAAVWAIAVFVAIISLRRRWRRRAPLGELLMRVPASLFFFALLASTRRVADPTPLVEYTLAFALPYLSLVSW